MVIGSAGGSGRGELVDWTVEIVREIAREQSLRFRLAWIYADIARERVEQALARGEVEDFEAGFALTREALDATTAIVAQMGWEPIAETLDAGADVVVAGRACDDLAIAAYPVLPEGLAIKLTLLRPRPQCSAGETDVYGCQQHVPLMCRFPSKGTPPTDSATVQS